jgi:hypothetical protein
MAELIGAAWFGGSTMSANASSNEMLILLRALERAETTLGLLPISPPQKTPDLQEANSKSSNGTAEWGANPLVERIAVAMSRLCDRPPTRVIG